MGVGVAAMMPGKVSNQCPGDDLAEDAVANVGLGL